MTAIADADIEETRRLLREDYPFWGRTVGKIVDKQGRKIPFDMNAGQLALNAKLVKQREMGAPGRVLVLKGRQEGFSTYIQGDLIQGATQTAHCNTITVAHDRPTGEKLYKIGETFYANLPEDKELGIKPAIGRHRRGLALHFADGSKDSWTRGEAWPDSTYMVDTAGEFEGGRGGTYRKVHGSEVAFWAAIAKKLAALQNGVPDDIDSLIALESTPNGHNEFKDLWDDAVAGRSDYIPFFWPWWKHEEYTLPFANDAERSAFAVGDGPYGEEEPDMVRDWGLTLEQLHWRRRTIANKCGGDLRLFHQEYPSSAAQGFLTSGRKAFDVYRVAQILVTVDLTDPREGARTAENPGPMLGRLEVESSHQEQGRVGTLTIPDKALWVPRQDGPRNSPWRMWVPEEVASSREHIIGVDVASGDDGDFDVIEVIDHEDRNQVAELHGHWDADELAEQVLLAALWFNMAWVAIEVTGSHGLPVANTLFHDYHYPYTYRAKRRGKTTEKTEKKLGFDTNTRTKPLMIAGTKKLIREDDYDGVKGRGLATEFETYVQNEKGGYEAEPGKHDDRLMAFMIAQLVASELPLKTPSGGMGRRAPRAPATGLGAYDPRIRSRRG